MCRRLVNGDGSLLEAGRLVCHCLLIETPRDGLVLVDTGLGQHTLDNHKTLGRFFLGAARPALRPEETALHQLQALGYTRNDVRHIVLTHLDLDHAGGIADFPEAEVHVYAPEHRAAMQPDFRSRARYVAAQWAHGPRWSLHDHAGDDWFGLAGLTPLPGVAEDILLVPLIGHTRGHAGVAVRGERGWLLHCGDAYFYRDQVAAQPHSTPGLSVFEKLAQTLPRERMQNLARLQQLAGEKADSVQLFCAHDPVEFAQLAAQP